MTGTIPWPADAADRFDACARIAQSHLTRSPMPKDRERPQDPFVHRPIATVDYGRDPVILEVRAAEVWLLTCGCIAAQSSKADRLPPYNRQLNDPLRIDTEPIRAVVTIDCSDLTNAPRSLGAPHTHGRPLVRLPVVDWYLQAQLEGIPAMLRNYVPRYATDSARHP